MHEDPPHLARLARVIAAVCTLDGIDRRLFVLYAWPDRGQDVIPTQPLPVERPRAML
jgi:hypothetical protein